MSFTWWNWWRSPPRVVDARRPVHDQRHVDAALVGVLLVPLERRVAGLRPAPRVVRVAVRAADLVDAVDRLVGRLEDEVEELHLVQDAERAALLAGAVVGEQDTMTCCRARRSPRGRRRSGRSARRCGRGTRRTPPAAGRPSAGGSRAGRPTARRPGCAARARCRRGRARAPSGGRTTRRGRRPSRRRSGRGTSRGTRPAPGAGVRGAEREVEEERPVGPDRLRVVDEPDRVVDQVLAEVVAVLGALPGARRGGCRRRARGGTGRSRRRGSRRSGRSRAAAATGRTARPPTRRAIWQRCHLPTANVV